jgi:hypothetical protein
MTSISDMIASTMSDWSDLDKGLNVNRFVFKVGIHFTFCINLFISDTSCQNCG